MNFSSPPPRRFMHLLWLGTALLAAGAIVRPASAEVVIDAANPAFNYYGRWHVGPTAVTVNSGSSVEFAYSGNACVLAFDVAGFAFFPGVFVQVDNGPVVRANLSAAVCAIAVVPEHNRLPQGPPPYAAPASGYHFVRFWAATHSLYRTPAAGRQWTTLVGACKFQGVRLAVGGTLLPVPYGSRQIEFLGDSITQGLRLLYTGTENDIGNQAPYANWPELTAELLGLKPVVTGFGGQAMTASGTAGAPPAAAAFPFIYAGAKWMPRVKPEAVVIYQGTNGRATSAEFETIYAAYLAEIRRAYPAAAIFAVCPHTRPNYAAAIQAAVAGRHDPRMFFLDYSTGVLSKGETCDVIGHLNPGGAVRLATKLAGDIAARREKDRE